MSRHHYAWTSLHDEGSILKKALKCDGIALTVLIDGKGKIVYYDFAGDEAALRKVIASLGPEFAPIAANSASTATH